MSRGVFHVLLENEMRCICTARRLESKRIRIMDGDTVIVEIPTTDLAYSPLRGRIVYREK